MMSLRLTSPIFLLFLLMFSGIGVSQQEWNVTYTPKAICALKGCTVIMGCRYTYPEDYTVQTVFWSRELIRDREPPDLSLDPKYRGRVQYLGNKRDDCSLRLSDVTEQDQGKYYFRFITTTVGGKYQGRDGVELSVVEKNESCAAEVDIQYPPKSVSVSISPPGEILEGSSVTLTCSSDANPPAETYNWYKGMALIKIGKTNTINRISSEDSGFYICQAKNIHGTQFSTYVPLNVLFPPKSVSVSISSFGEMLEGSSVTLTCSSDAKPPVETYTWYKVNESSPLGTGQSYSFILSSNSSGWFYCMAQNKYGNQTAAAVLLTLNEGRRVVLYVVLGVAVGCGCVFAIIGVLCVRRKRKGGSGDDAKSTQDAHCSPPDDTYTALDLRTRSPNAVYDTLAAVHPSPSNDTNAALDS